MPRISHAITQPVSPAKVTPAFTTRQITLSGERLMQFLLRGKRREIFISIMERTTKNGVYKLTYHESNNQSGNHRGCEHP